MDLKQSYETLRENLRLKKEIEQRDLTELHLRMAQKRLASILDAQKDVIIAVNQDIEIIFCNSNSESLLGYGTDMLLGKSVFDIFTPDSRKKAKFIMEQMFNSSNHPRSRDSIKKFNLIKGDSTHIKSVIRFAVIETDDEQLLIIKINKPEKNKSIDRISAELFLKELNRNRHRIKILDEYITNPSISSKEQVIGKGLKEVDKALEELEKTFREPNAESERKKLGVRVMNLALEYWIESTGSSKVDLAVMSGLWKVYMNENGFERTQTLDKYLDIRLFPKVPRWSKVYRTVDFVLLSCQDESDLRTELEKTFLKFQMLN